MAVADLGDPLACWPQSLNPPTDITSVDLGSVALLTGFIIPAMAVAELASEEVCLLIQAIVDH